jgi:ABC-2 type transport system ATP-binding protein
MAAINVRELTKRFGNTEALSQVSFRVEEGELFGLIGPDGAGKSTLMRILCTLIPPDAGNVQVLGHDVRRDFRAIREHIGYMPQQFSLYSDLSVEQNLLFFAELFRVPTAERQKRMEQLFRFSRLGPFQKRKAGQLSGGMKQKLALSCALIHTPRLLLLDEPTYGVDPVSRAEFWNLLDEIRSQGTSIFVSTAYMDEAERCDRVAFLYEGKILAIGTPEELRSRFPYRLFRVEGKDLRQLKEFFLRLPEARDAQLFGDSVHVSFEKDPEPRQWQQWKHDSGGLLERHAAIDPGIEDVFMSMIEESRE